MTTYDPNKRYTWTPEDTFTLSGQEFGLILNTIRAVLSTEQAAQVMLAQKASEVIDSIMSKSVEAGVIVEAPEVTN